MKNNTETALEPLISTLDELARLVMLIPVKVAS